MRILALFAVSLAVILTCFWYLDQSNHRQEPSYARQAGDDSRSMAGSTGVRGDPKGNIFTFPQRIERASEGDAIGDAGAGQGEWSGPIESQESGFREVGRLVDGKREGLWRSYNDAGVVWEEAEYSEGLLDGMARLFHTPGNVAQEAEYRAGVLHGKSTDYYPDGAIWREATYAKGKRNGECREWYPNGYNKSECQYVNGMLDGACLFWLESGVLDEDRTGVYRQDEKIADLP